MLLPLIHISVTRIPLQVMVFKLRRSYLVISSFVVFIILAHSCMPCFNLKSRETIDQNKGTYIQRSSLYEGSYHLEHNGKMMKPTYSLVLFNNGYILVVPGGNDSFFKNLEQRSDNFIYGNTSGFQWGKYYINDESLNIEFITNISSGGGCKIRSLRYSGRYDENQIEILSGPENEYKVGPSQYILPKDGLSLSFVKAISDSLIDPTKAKLLK